MNYKNNNFITPYYEHFSHLIKVAPIAVLLSGPSIEESLHDIQKLKDKNILYFAVNNKFIIDKIILSHINKKVNVWCLLSPEELNRLTKYDYAVYEAAKKIKHKKMKKWHYANSH